MRVAVSSDGKVMESAVSEVFGRCRYFIIADIEGGKISKTDVMENVSAKQVGAAGVSVAQAVVERDAKAVITGNVGPRASDVLRQFKVDVYKGSGTVKEALQKFIDRKLEKMQ